MNLPSDPVELGAALAVLLLVVALLFIVVRRRARQPAVELAERLAEEEAEEKTAAIAEPPPRVRLRAALAKSREAFRSRLDAALGRSRNLEAVLEGLEEAMLGADVGVATTTRIVDGLRQRFSGKREVEEPDVRAALREAIEESLAVDGAPEHGAKPWVILVAGVNGVGKTTTIGKLAARLGAEGSRVLLVAGDTFRAAAIDQLGIWAERVGAEIVRHQTGADPASVAFDGIKAAEARGADVVIVDTAGRLHTRENLMEELRKVSRVIGKAAPGAPHEVLLVLDATTGQNAVAQAKIFSQALGVTGIVLTKLDGTAKGGAALAVRTELGVPIRWIGVGEAVDDLRPFSAVEFAAALVGDGDGPGQEAPAAASVSSGAAEM